MALGILTSGFKQIVHTGRSAVQTATHSVESTVEHTASDAVHLSAEALEHIGQGLLDDVTPAPPKYESLTAGEQAQVAKGEQAGAGKSVPEESIVDAGGKHHEPVNIEFTGSQAQLQKALQSQGWKTGYEQGHTPNVLGDILHGNLAGLVPFSTQKAENEQGKLVDPTFQMAKDSTGLNRHHLRVYRLGTNDGQPLWGIASSRDNKALITLNHESDKNVDPEQTTILHDLFQAQQQDGGKLNLTVVDGQPGGTTTQLPNGQYDVNNGQYNSALKVDQINFN